MIYSTERSQFFSNLHSKKIKNTKYSIILKPDSQQDFIQRELGRSEKYRGE